MHPTTESRQGPVPAPIPAASPDPQNHHLWRNGRYWWIAITVYDRDGRKRRERKSLRTPDVALARARRDLILAHVARSTHWRLAKPPASSAPSPRPLPTSQPAASGVAA